MKALDDMLQVMDYCPKGVDGVIVAVVHDEFWGMGVSGMQGVMGEGDGEERRGFRAKIFKLE